jgi:hypothetical protein
MVDWDSAIFTLAVAVVVPALTNWSIRLARGASDSGTTFRPSPVLRAVYPGVMIACLLLDCFYAKELWEAKRLPGVMDCVCLAGMLALALMCVITWPPTIFATPVGLRWWRLLSRRFIPWDQIEAAYIGMKRDMVIIAKGNQRYEVSEHVQGLEQLRAIIKEKLTELHGPNVCVR